LKLEYILLGLINIHPLVSGYELKTIINKSTGYFFTASLSQIYPALKELAQRGYITYEVEPLVGKQDRKVYNITPSGRDALVEWLKEPLVLDQSMNAFEDFLLKLTIMGFLDDESIQAYLASGLKYFESEIKRVTDNNLSNERNYLKLGSPDKERFILLWSQENEFLIDDLNRKIRWIEEVIEKINSKK
jgi:DNA-binding PadR family transcriptional regulator